MIYQWVGVFKLWYINGCGLFKLWYINGWWIL